MFRVLLPCTLLVSLGFLTLTIAVEFCPNGYIHPSPFPPYSSPVLKITTYNTYFLFNKTKEEFARSPWENRTEVENHINNIVKVLQTINADLYNFCEVEDCSVVKTVLDRMNTQQSETRKVFEIYAVKGTDTYTKQNAVLMSSFPVVNNEVFRVEDRVEYPLSYSKCGYGGAGTTAVSKHFFTVIKVHKDLDPIIIASVHLKAIPTDPKSCAQREGQAEVIKGQIIKMMELNKTENIIIMGDFNDFDGTIQDKEEDIPTSVVVARLKQELDLFNVIERLPQDERYSYWWASVDKLSLIDHILVSKNLVPLIKSVKIETDLYPHGNYSFSDHWPVTLELDLKRINSVNIATYVAIVVFNCIAVIALVGFLTAFVLAIVLGKYAAKKVKRNNYKELSDEKGQVFEDK